MQVPRNQMDLCDPLQVYKKISTIARVELVLFPVLHAACWVLAPLVGWADQLQPLGMCARCDDFAFCITFAGDFALKAV